MAGKRLKILITAGGTREYIDPVRFISNAGSGRMGYAIASAAIKAGHRVILITAPTALKPPQSAKVTGVETAAQMFASVKKYFPLCDCLIMSAAVSDYTPLRRSKTKLKKSKTQLVIKLKPTTDILTWAGRNKRKGQVVIGFALEDKNLRTKSAQKLAAKNLDAIVANTPRAIGAARSTAWIKSSGSVWSKISAAKQTIAAQIIALAERLYLRKSSLPCPD